MKRKAFFLDRDGVVVKQVHYLCEPEKTELEKNVVQAIRKLRQKGYMVIVVTNQSGVARGKFTIDAVEAVHRKIEELLAAENEKIDAFYICPHHPDFDGDCDCRKPAPGLILKAAEEHNIDISSSVMIGDKLSDVKCGENAGVKYSVLIATGYGSGERQKPEAENVLFVNDLEEAVKKYS